MPSCAMHKLLLVALLSISYLFINAQEPQPISPYSAFGLGDLSPGNFAEQRIMGGVSLGLREHFVMLPDFAASYSNLLKPVFMTGMRTQFLKETTTTQEVDLSFAEFMGIQVGLPLPKGGWGAGFGLMPVSDVGFDLRNQGLLPTGEAVEFRYTGNGGINKMFAGLSKRVYFKHDSLGYNFSKLILGAQMNYNFGSIGTTRRTIFPRNAGFYNTNSTANSILRDVSFDVSTQFQKGFRTYSIGKDGDQKKHDWLLTAGAFVGLPANLGARRTELTTTYITSTLGVEFAQDTVSFIDRAKGKLQLPTSYGIGAGLSFDDKFELALEYRIQDWNDLDIQVEGWELPTDLGVKSSYAIGLSYNAFGFTKPRYNAPFFQATTVRMGFRAFDDYLIINNSQLGGNAVSLGFSMPIAADYSWSTLTIGTELGTRGSVENNGVKEDYTEFVIGFTITPAARDKWFIKRRIE